MLRLSTAVLVAAVFAGAPFQGARPQEREWPVYGADQGGTKYSPLSDINRSNVSRLAVAWQWSTGEKAAAEFGTRPGNFQATPIMIGGVL